jgi:hypothetical protein
MVYIPLIGGEAAISMTCVPVVSIKATINAQYLLWECLFVCVCVCAKERERESLNAIVSLWSERVKYIRT